MRSPLRRALLALTAALALVACGGGASREEFSREANAVCQDIERDIAQLNQGQARNERDAQRRIDGVRRKIGEARGRLEGLEVPGGENGEKAERWVTEFTKAARQGEQALGQLIPALRARDQRRLQQLTQQLQGLNSDRLDRLARDAGANECAG